jgi:GNAT superfamily N-acetyltransferase
MFEGKGGAGMKLFKWSQFTWDLQKLPALQTALPSHYKISPAQAGDEMALRKVFSSSFLLDPAWNSAIGHVMRTIQSRLDAALASDAQTCLALRHGQRIIGAVVLHPDAAVGEQFAIGPSILVEYRNRGLGLQLLHAALEWLKDAGMTRATAISLEHTPATKFLYPKFDSVVERVEPVVLLAA